MPKATVLMTTAAFLAGGLAGAAFLFKDFVTDRAAAHPPRPIWTEVQWPFPMDQWGRGKAFHCKAADCGAEVNVYVRAKIGFCDCSNGVADDQELDRVSDFELMGNPVAPQGAGRPVAVAWMKGRRRAFAIGDPEHGAMAGLSVGFNDRCDAIVATAVLKRERLAAIEPAVIEFLNSRTVLRWAEVTLGL
jgi:hypothetical protein